MQAEVEKNEIERQGRVLLTGATGFLGRGLVPGLAAAGYKIRAATRDTTALSPEIESAVVGDLRRPINLSEALRDVDFIVHSAGLTNSAAGVPEETYREVNAGITETLANAASKAGVKRFVLLSSVRAQIGPTSSEIVTEDQPARPLDAYGRSKLEAERLLADADVPFVILRLALTHGVGMRFNMLELLQLARLQWPLPLGAFRAKRSILARDHLVDVVALAASNGEMEG
jgi:nucleoside-diphosphate-sugar epimerase